MSIYSNLESIRQLSNSSLTSIVDVTNLNFKSLSEANLNYLKNIKYDEKANDFTVNKGTFKKVDITDTLSLTLDGIPTFTINSLGKAEGQELLVVVSESQRHRFTDFNDWPEIGVPGEVIYTGVQNQRPEFGEDFIGYLDGRGWVSLTNLTAPVDGLYLLPEAGSPLVIPTVPNGQGLLWIGPPGNQTKYEPVNTTVYFTDDEGNTYDIMTDFAWEIIGDDAKFKPPGKAIIGDVFNPGKFQFVDNNEQPGYVLHSDGNGNAYWGPNLGISGPSSPNYSYWAIDSYTADVTKTVYHNLGTLNIVVDLIDVNTNEKIEGHIDNYKTNSVDITLVESKSDIKVVILGSGGTPLNLNGATILNELTDVSLMSPIADGDVLAYDLSSGTWINTPGSAGGGETLAQTLVLGKLTGGNDIVTSDGDVIVAQNGLGQLNLRYNGWNVDDVILSTDGGAWFNEAQLLLSTDTTELSNYATNGKIGILANPTTSASTIDGTIYIVGKNTSIRSRYFQLSSPPLAGFTSVIGEFTIVPTSLNLNLVTINDIASGDLEPTALSTKWATADPGVKNSVALGGVGIYMRTPNTAYVNQIAFSTGGNFETILNRITATADRIHTLQDESGTIPVGPDWDTLIANPTAFEDGKVIAWNSINNEYELVPNGGGSNPIQTPDDKFLNSIATINDGDVASNGTITNTPVDGCYVEARINGIEYEVGNGVTTKVCYFADPATPTVPRGFSSSHPNGQVQAGDKLYWNGSIIGFQLLNGWRVSFHYLTI